MSRLTIIAERCKNSEVAAALGEHRADRAALLSSLTTSLESDSRVLAAWLWGSFGRGEADDLSDLDIWIIVFDEAMGEFGISLRQYAQRTGSFITGGESPRNAPPGGGYFGSLHEGRHGLLHLDCYWQPASAVADVPNQAVLFDRRDSLPGASSPPKVPVISLKEEDRTFTEEEDRIAGGIGFAWLMLSVTAKTLARHPDSDMALIAYPRPGLEEAARRLGHGSLIDASDWSVPDNPLAKAEMLRRLTEKTARLTEAANGRGLDLSPVNAVCLFRYIDLVEGILR